MANSRHASYLALLWSLQGLEELGRVRVWTFTLPAPEHGWFPVAKKWHKLLARLHRRKFDMRGVRIVEWHPGGHGWHIHWPTVGWLPVQSVRACAQACGFGHVNVICNLRGHYYAKHFSKDRDREQGMRKWGCTGGYKGIKVSEVHCQSTWTAFRRVKVGKAKLSYLEECRLWRQYLFDIPGVKKDERTRRAAAWAQPY